MSSTTTQQAVQPPAHQPVQAPVKIPATDTSPGTDVSDAVPVPQPETPEERVAAHLEWIMQSFATGINKREFDFVSGGLSHHVATDFVAPVDMSPYFIGEYCQRDPENATKCLPGKGKDGMMGVADYAKMVHLATTTFPDLELRGYDFDTKVDLVGGKAQMYFNSETYGMGDVVIPSTCVVDFVKFPDGLWKMVRFRGIRGMEFGF